MYYDASASLTEQSKLVYPMWRRRNQNYERSNAVLDIPIAINAEARHLTAKILESQVAQERQRLGIALLDELTEAAQINICELRVEDSPQAHRHHGKRMVYKKYGHYVPKTKGILIYNRTAVRGQILAPKSFLETLLHEWVHHYDFEKLKLNSIHTLGFYRRLNNLRAKLTAGTTAGVAEYLQGR